MTWPELFDHFYREYPKKVAPEAARRAWMKKAPRDKGSNIQRANEILDRLEERMTGEWAGRERQHIPYPATFLNAEFPDTSRQQARSPARPKNSSGRAQNGRGAAVLPFPGPTMPKEENGP